MAQPPLANATDLADWLGETIAEGDSRAAAVLSAASALVREYTMQSWLDATDSSKLGDVPDAVHAVTLAVAGRAWRRAGDVDTSTEQAGPFAYTQRFGGDGGGLYLTATDKLMLRAHRVSQPYGVGVLSTTRGEDGDSTIYVPVSESDAVFPWYDANDPSASL